MWQISHQFKMFPHVITNETCAKFWPCCIIRLTHWDRVTHVCVSKLTIIGSDNGLSPGRRQAIIWTNAGIFLIQTLGANFSEILSEIRAFSFKEMDLKMSSAKWRRFCLGLIVLRIKIRTNDFSPKLEYELIWNYNEVVPFLNDNHYWHQSRYRDSFQWPIHNETQCTHNIFRDVF